MAVKIGNIEPNTSIEINIRFIEQLETSRNLFWRYSALGSIKPKYKSPSSEQNPTGDFLSIMEYPFLSSESDGAY